MSSASSLACLTALTLFSNVALFGCELQCTENENSQGGTCVAKSLKRFKGEPQVKSVPWSAGESVEVQGVHGDIVVLEGTGNEVVVTFEPFSYRAHDSGDAARQEMSENLVLSVEMDAGVSIVTARDGGNDGLGARIVVALPPSFDGHLSVENAGASSINPGNLDVQFVGASPKVSLLNEGTGSCDLSGGASVTTTDVVCGGAAQVRGVADDVSITTMGLETGTAIVLELSAIGPNATGGKVVSRDGSIEVTFPVTGAYSVVASSPTQGEVEFGTPPSSCNVAASSPWTLSCGSGGASYTLTAGDQGLGESHVKVSYQ